MASQTTSREVSSVTVEGMEVLSSFQKKDKESSQTRQHSKKKRKKKKRRKKSLL
jgi:hypothetical protein